MIRFTSSNGKKIKIAEEDYNGHFVCWDCEKSTISHWNKKKLSFSEVYLSSEELTAIVLAKGLLHRADLIEDGKYEVPEDGYLCLECMTRRSTEIDFVPTPPDEDDYEGAYGKPRIRRQ